MSYDPYANCPCGSGKKVKFCCQDVIADMQKVGRLRENQPSRALQILLDLEQGHPQNLWVASSHARLLMESSDYHGARDRCNRFLENNEEHARHPEINAILALASFVCDGYEASKRNIHRAFQLSSRQSAAIISRLAGAISLVMLEAESFMSARAHAALAVKTSTEDRRAHCVRQLAEIEGSSRIPYPLRSVHRLVPYTAAVEDQKDFDRAVRLSALGCWHPATILLKRIAEKHSQAPEVWHNLGLCHAWDGNEPLAAEALHKAAKLYQDPQPAIECETLAQLLDLELTEDVTEIAIRSYSAKSVGQLLTALDADPVFERLLIEAPIAEDGPVAQYRILEHPFPRDKNPDDVVLDDIPEFIADLVVFDGDEDDPPLLQVSGVEGDEFEAARQALDEAAGDLLELDEDSNNEPLGVVPRELEGLEWNCHFPPDFPSGLARNLEARKMQQVADDIWPSLPLTGLGGKTPSEAAGDENLAVPLQAAVYVLDAFYDRNNVMLDVRSIRGNLQLEEPPSLLPGDTSVNRLSTLALQRVPFADLPDEQLVDIARRLLMVRHTRTAYEALTEAAARPGCIERIGAERLFSTLVGICREQNLIDEALKWLAAGRDAARAADRSFQNILEWDVRELNLRADDPADSEIPALWKKFEEQYFPKLPELRDGMVDFMQEKKLGHLVSEVATVGAGGGSEGVWTPGSDDEDTGEQQKLWVPGQD